MIVTLKGLRDRVLAHLDERDDTGTTKSLVDEALNYAHQQRCTEYPWPFMLWPSVETITVEAGRRQYSLHYELHRLLYLLNRTSQALLREVPWRTLPASGIDWVNDSGTPTSFSLIGHDIVSRQPTVTAPLVLFSDSSLDTGSTNQVVLKGEDSTGQVRAELLTPLGAVSVTTAYSYRKVLGLSKETEWSGNLTLQDGAGVTLLSLLPTEMGRRYPQIALLEAPATGTTLEYRFYKQPMLLINDYDQPSLPAEHCQLLVWDALIQLGGYLTSTNGQTLRIWKDLAFQAQLALYQAYGNESQTLGAEPSYVRYIEDSDSAPRIIT